MEVRELCEHTILGLVFILTFGILHCNAGHGETFELDTGIGRLVGLTDMIEFDGEFKPATRFLGVPYAKPPVGSRRFSRPEPYGNFSTLHNATYHRPHCMQTRLSYQYIKANYNQSEDCLYLNIYTPGNSSLSNNSYAVMIYIHGGSFIDGGADIYDGDKLAAFHDTVLVSINYRLNVFGFLSDGVKNLGNNGLWDMKMAIQWVHDNIADFGGDPTRVTLFGQSAGGAAVMYQGLNPANRGLFQRIIAQSGSSFAFWAFQKTPFTNFFWFSSTVGCNQTLVDDVMRCLREKPAEELKLEENQYTAQFIPSIDNEFLHDDPVSLSKRTTDAGKAAMDFFSEIDMINGVTSSDGAMAMGYWAYRMQMANVSNVNLTEGVPKDFLTDIYIPEKLSGVYDNLPPLVLHSFQYQYTDWSNVDDPKAVRTKLLDFESDVSFFVPSTYSSKIHGPEPQNASRNNYFYVFDQKPDFAPDPEWLTGATHFMDLPYVFGFPKAFESKLIKDYGAKDPFQLSESDLMFSKNLMRLWTNFAKTGDPNLPVGDDQNTPAWPTFDSKGQRYLELKTRMTSESVKNHLAGSRVAFWENMLPELTDCATKSSSGAYTHSVSALTSFVLGVCLTLLISSFT